MPMIKKLEEKETRASVKVKVEQNVHQRLRPYMDRLSLKELPVNLVLVGLKEEQILEVHVVKEHTIELLKKYPFTGFSGELGPKLKQGDLQIPEGIYNIEYLNPNSSYYLSMKISYPNSFDISKSSLSSVGQMGGDIFIHGKSMTVGCIPIGDEAIEELFLLVDHALNSGVKVIISPRDFREGKAYPKINHIDWEDELYELIEKELNQYPTT